MALSTRFALACVLVACGSSGDGGDPIDAGPGLCTGPGDCDDGRYCNGAEVCMPGGPASDVRGCAAGPAPCDEGACDEDRDECTSSCVDADGDGAEDAACGGTDCDDTDADVFPGATEVCDAAGRDEDCDPTTFGARDVDGDGFFDQACCNGSTCGRDCDDARAGTNPAVPEVCDELDNDCNGTVDEGLLQSVFIDADRDLHGDPERPISACPGLPGTSASSLDCDDTDPFINGPQFEVSDGADNDCDDRIDEDPRAVLWFPDADGDRYGDPTGETVLSSSVVDGHSLIGNDCDDTSSAISPVAEERCNGRDDDCDGRADFVVAINDFEDDDGDGVPDAACAGAGGDCDDGDPGAFPGAAELCENGRDDDCDGDVDEGCDAAPPEDFATDCASGCAVPFDLGSAGALGGLTRVCGEVPVADFDAPEFDFATACAGSTLGEIAVQASVWHTVNEGICEDRFSTSFDAASGRVGIHSCNRDRLGVGGYDFVEEGGRRFLYVRVDGAPVVPVLELVGGDVASAVRPCSVSVGVDGVCATGSVSFPPFPGPSDVALGLRGTWLRCNDGTLSADPTATELAALCTGAREDFSSAAPGRVVIFSAGERSEYEFSGGASDTSPMAESCNRPARSIAGDRLQLWNAFDGVVAVETETIRTVSGGSDRYLVRTTLTDPPEAFVEVTLGTFTDPCETAPPLDFSLPE
ncbi:MAG: putative metal-binding motif-containing protein [Myxococcota bacterium]